MWGRDHFIAGDNVLICAALQRCTWEDVNAVKNKLKHYKTT